MGGNEKTTEPLTDEKLVELFEIFTNIDELTKEDSAKRKEIERYIKFANDKGYHDYNAATFAALVDGYNIGRKEGK